jgi:hypothetical protein
LKKLRAVEKLIQVSLLPGGEDPRPQAKPTRRQPVAHKPAAKQIDPARAERARNRRPRRTRKAA